MKKIIKNDGKKIIITAIVALIVIVVVAVNMFFLFVAKHTFSGVITEDAYHKGLKYNQTIAENKLQAEHISGSILQKRANHRHIIFRSSRQCDEISLNLFATTMPKSDFTIEKIDKQNALSYYWELPKEINGPWLLQVRCTADDQEYYFSKKANFY